MATAAAAIGLSAIGATPAGAPRHAQPPTTPALDAAFTVVGGGVATPVVSASISDGKTKSPAHPAKESHDETPSDTHESKDHGRQQCSAPSHRGGDWASLNGGANNSRNQSSERLIGPNEAKGLRPKWSFSGVEVGAPGGARSTPIVADGCVYLALGQGYLGDRGDVIALDADTGELIWHVRLEGSVLGLAAANGMIYVTPSLGTRGDVAMPVVSDSYVPAGSYAVALDAHTGKRMWTSARLDDGNPGNGTFINASPVAYDAGGKQLLFVPLAGGAGDGAKVPMYFLDARTGRTVKKAYTLTPAEYAAGYGGTGIWSTAAFDPGTQHLYAGTADSDAHTHQHPYNDALLKIDANPRRTTFGSVVAAYSGTTEHANLDAYIGESHNPACGAFGGTGVHPPTFVDTSASVECLEMDFDFGGSPNLYSDESGRLRVGALQKSGIYHSVDAAQMTGAWNFVVGPGGAAMDGATAAVGSHDIYVGATPNLVFGLGRANGQLRWVSASFEDLFAYQPLSLANGVLYTINDAGFLVAIDAASGVPLLHRQIATDGDFEQCLGVGAGVAIARNLVFAPCDAGGLHDLAGLPSPSGGLVAYG